MPPTGVSITVTYNGHEMQLTVPSYQSSYSNPDRDAELSHLRAAIVRAAAEASKWTREHDFNRRVDR